MLEQTVCFDRENSFAEGLFYHSAMGWTIAAQNIVFMCPGEYAEQLCNVHRGHNIWNSINEEAQKMEMKLCRQLSDIWTPKVPMGDASQVTDPWPPDPIPP